MNNSDRFSEAGYWPDARCKTAWRAHCRDELGLELALTHSRVLSGAWQKGYLYELRVRLREAVRQLDEDASLLAEVLVEVLEITGQSS
jgi:hypothetical protein